MAQFRIWTKIDKKSLRVSKKIHCHKRKEEFFSNLVFDSLLGGVVVFCSLLEKSKRKEQKLGRSQDIRSWSRESFFIIPKTTCFEPAAEHQLLRKTKRSRIIFWRQNRKMLEEETGLLCDKSSNRRVSSGSRRGDDSHETLWTITFQTECTLRL